MIDVMSVVAITGKKEIKQIQIPRPQPEPNEVLIRIRSCALCTWEQRVYTGDKDMPLPLVGGHEISGYISAVGERVDPEAYPVGTRVACRIIRACQSCDFCRRGIHTQCLEQGTFLLNGPDVYGMGGLAEYVCLDRSAVWCFPDDLSYEEIALTEPLACVIHSINQAKPAMGDDALIIGGGTMGQLHVLCMNKLGIRTILSEPNADRRAFAKENGCNYLINPVEEDVVARVRDITNGRGAEMVFNTTAIPEVTPQAINMMANAGRYIAYSSQHPDKPVPMSPGWLHSSEAILTGAVNPSIVSFNQAANVISKKILDVSGLISATYPADEAKTAFERALSMDTYRVFISL
jgi:L-iditol 2-dehydrogenase